MSEYAIDLGHHVRDRISGFEGIVTDIGYHLTGCTRYGAMPVDTDATSHRGETEFFYGAQLEVVEARTEFREAAENAVRDVSFELGDEVEDDVTGYAGLATTITVNLFNCPRVAIQPVDARRPLSDDIEREWFDTPRVEIVGEGISADYEELVNEEMTAKTGSAGDVQRKVDKR